MSGVCLFVDEIKSQCDSGVLATYPGSSFFIDPQGMDSWQLVCVFLLYGYVLFLSADMIGDGAELLLLIPAYKDMVGSMVLPILGAIPDGMMVLFSGVGPLAVAQENVAVGVGALAGSTIMLLTLPWVLSVYYGQVDMTTAADGTVDMVGYKAKKGKKAETATTGCQFQAGVTKNAILMFVTSLSYFVIQIPAYLVDDQKTKAEYDSEGSYLKAVMTESKSENQWALIGLFTTLFLFFFYLYLQFLAATKKTNVSPFLKFLLPPIDEAALAEKIADHGCALYVLKYREDKEAGVNVVYDMGDALVEEGKPKLPANLKNAIETLFKKHKHIDETTKKDALTDHDMWTLLGEAGLNFRREAFKRQFTAADTDKSGTMDEVEFQKFFDKLIRLGEKDFQGLYQEMPREEEGGDDDDEEEEEEPPDDIKSLPAHEQKPAILKKSVKQMLLGTLLVLVFSDPMVDVLSQIGRMTGVPAFYVSFLLAPLASNASELVASMKLAAKKTSTSITQSLQCLEGAACMNNTFCLGIFFLLIYYQGLAWKFTAETLSIFFVQLLVFALVQKSTVQTKSDGLIVFLCYPLSLVFVYVLENYTHLD